MNQIEKDVISLLQDRFDNAEEETDLVGCVEGLVGFGSTREGYPVCIDYDFRVPVAYVEFYDDEWNEYMPDGYNAGVVEEAVAEMDGNRLLYERNECYGWEKTDEELRAEADCERYDLFRYD